MCTVSSDVASAGTKNIVIIKFLVDFKTFAQTEEGEYLPQMPVKPIFDDAYITGLLEAYVTEQQAKDAEVAKQMPKVIERITNEIVKPAKNSDRQNKNRASNGSPLTRRSVKQRSVGSTHEIMSSTAAARILGIENIANCSESVKEATITARNNPTIR